MFNYALTRKFTCQHFSEKHLFDIALANSGEDGALSCVYIEGELSEEWNNPRMSGATAPVY